MGQFKNKITRLAEKAGAIKEMGLNNEFNKIVDFANSIELIYKILELVDEPIYIGNDTGYKKFTITTDEQGHGIMIFKFGPLSYSIILYYGTIGISHFLTMHDNESIYTFMNKIKESQYFEMCDFIDFIYEYLEQKVG